MTAAGDANNINDSGITMYDLYDAQREAAYNLADDAGKDDNKDKVLFQIAQGGAINMKPYMTTTPLTFVTEKATAGGSEVNSAKGVKLLTITYTVGLKYNVATSANITNTSEVINNDNLATHQGTNAHTVTTTP